MISYHSDRDSDCDLMRIVTSRLSCLCPTRGKSVAVRSLSIYGPFVGTGCAIISTNWSRPASEGMNSQIVNSVLA